VSMDFCSLQTGRGSSNVVLYVAGDGLLVRLLFARRKMVRSFRYGSGGICWSFLFGGDNFSRKFIISWGKGSFPNLVNCLKIKGKG